jgi:hypothetical protein
MKLKKIFLILFFLTALWYLDYGISQDCTPPPGPPPDNADENFSFNLEGANITVFSPYLEEFPFIGILENGNVEAMEKLLEKIGRDWIYVGKNFNPVDLVKSVNLLIIPTGGLFGVQSSPSSQLKLLLEQYVSCGGHILCFAEQDSLDYQAIPVPFGESLHAVGWRSSQSCYHGAIYFSQTGPIFSGQTSQRISAGVDGGFSTVPQSAEILVKRTAN